MDFKNIKIEVIARIVKLKELIKRDLNIRRRCFK